MQRIFCFLDFFINLVFLFLCLTHEKAETSDDLFEWKTALEQALAQAPSAALVMGHNGIFRSDTSDKIDSSFHPCLYSASFCNYLFIMMLDSFSNAWGRYMRVILAYLINQCSINYIQGGISVLLNLWWWEDLFYLHWKILMEVHLSLRRHFGFLKHSVGCYVEIIMKSVLFSVGSFWIIIMLFLFVDLLYQVVRISNFLVIMI